MGEEGHSPNEAALTSLLGRGDTPGNPKRDDGEVPVADPMLLSDLLGLILSPLSNLVGGKSIPGPSSESSSESMSESSDDE